MKRHKKSKYMLGVGAILAALSLGGCAVAPSVGVHSLEVDRPTVVTTDASARAVIVLPKPDGKGMYSCS